MFTYAEKELIVGALEQAIASQKRAQNSSKNPMLIPVYKQIQNELEAVKLKVTNTKDK